MRLDGWTTLTFVSIELWLTLYTTFIYAVCGPVFGEISIRLHFCIDYRKIKRKWKSENIQINASNVDLIGWESKQQINFDESECHPTFTKNHCVKSHNAPTKSFDLFQLFWRDENSRFLCEIHKSVYLVVSEFLRRTTEKWKETLMNAT